MNSNEGFVGTGWAFPPTFDYGSKSVAIVSGREDIESSLHLLLSTRPGERVMQPTYGCNLDHMLFAPLDTSLKTFMSDLIRTAILYHEPRIDVIRVTLTAADETTGVILIDIEYVIRSNNSRGNLVHPFHRS